MGPFGITLFSVNLRDQKVLFLDCQTTGASPAHGRLLELGWAFASANQGKIKAQSQLIQQPEGEIPRHIARITGIRAEDLVEAPEVDQVWSELLSQLGQVSENVPAIIHYARFELPFLQDAQQGEKLPFESLCTYEVARRLYPDLPSRSIRAVSGFLGHPLGEMKRAAHHVEATYFIWSELVETLEKKAGIVSLEDLKEWMSETIPIKKGPKQYALSKETRLELPDEPGVYYLKGAGNRVLYVGKATSLKSRVNSYFRGRKTKGARLNELVSQVVDVETKVTGSALEAALLETDQIKQLSPPYNRALKIGNREITYVDRALGKLEEPTKGCLGPFTGERRFAELQVLFEFSDPAAVVELLDPFSISEQVVLEGYRLFEAQHGVAFSRDPGILRHLLCQSFINRILRNRERIREKGIEIDEDNEEVELSEPEQSQEDAPWEPEDFASYLNSVLAGTAMRIFRGRWLLRLMNSELRWKKGKSPWRTLIVREGRIVKRRTKKKPNRQSQLKELNLLTYDRMNVLRTEILKLLRKNCEVHWTPLVGGTQLTQADLKRLMFPEYFDE